MINEEENNEIQDRVKTFYKYFEMFIESNQENTDPMNDFIPSFSISEINYSNRKLDNLKEDIKEHKTNLNELYLEDLLSSLKELCNNTNSIINIIKGK